MPRRRQRRAWPARAASPSGRARRAQRAHRSARSPLPLDPRSSAARRRRRRCISARRSARSRRIRRRVWLDRDLGELDQHRQVDAGDHLHACAAFIIEIARLLGVPPNMSVSSTTPSPVSTSAMRLSISCAAALHVVVGADADGGDVALRADHMLHGRAQFVGEPAVGDQIRDRSWVGCSGLLTPELPGPRGGACLAAGGRRRCLTAPSLAMRHRAAARRLRSGARADGAATRSTRCTERCRPPVQPIAMVTYFLPSCTKRGSTRASRSRIAARGRRRNPGRPATYAATPDPARSAAAVPGRSAGCAGSARRAPGRPRAAGRRDRRRTPARPSGRHAPSRRRSARSAARSSAAGAASGRSEVSITRSAASRSAPVSAFSAAMPSSTRPSGASGWRRRVSV